MIKQQPGVLALPEHLLAAVFLAAGDAELPALRLACKGFLRPANEATRRLTLRGGADVQLSHYHSVEEVDASQAAWSDSWLEETLPQVGGEAPGWEQRILHFLNVLRQHSAASPAPFQP
jgi:hypothetical protein